jgi:dihydrofolate reductase
MRLVTYSAACSLDGYLTDRAGAMDWLHFSPDAQAALAATWAEVDTVLMGRRTWEPAAAQGGAPPVPGVRTYVFSRTLTAAPDGSLAAGVQLVAEDAGPFVRDLKRQPGRGIFVMGGGELAAALFDAEVIDEVVVNVHPVLLGGGAPMFGAPARRAALELTAARALPGGCVLATYRASRRTAA